MTPKEHELDFWKGFIKTDRFLNGWVANTPTPELHQFVKDFFIERCPMGGTVLDIGSGVVSILHGLNLGLLIIACDLLAEEYKEIFNYELHKIHPAYPIAGEELEFNAEFDFVHCSNALDHTTDPQLVFDNMVRALKPNGYIIVQGFENEAEHEKYQGMHQHNLRVEDEKLVPIDTSAVDHFRSFRFENHYQGRTWFIWIGQKLQ